MRDLTNQQWEILHPFLPLQKPKVGRPSEDHRTIINGILWLNRTGAPWRDLPERYGCWSTVASRFYRWRSKGIWQQILSALQQQTDAEQELNWDMHYVDSSVIRAHQHAAGAKDSNPEAEALGRSVGGFSTKIHLRIEGNGKPMVMRLTAGQQHEATELEPLMEQGAVKRQGTGRPRVRPFRVVGDKAYSSGKIRRYLRRHGIRLTIPRRSNERHRGKFDRAIYRERNRVERTINRLKQFRRVATRYEKRAENYLAMLTIAAILLWL